MSWLWLIIGIISGWLWTTFNVTLGAVRALLEMQKIQARERGVQEGSHDE